MPPHPQPAESDSPFVSGLVLGAGGSTDRPPQATASLRRRHSARPRGRGRPRVPLRSDDRRDRGRRGRGPPAGRSRRRRGGGQPGLRRGLLVLDRGGARLARPAVPSPRADARRPARRWRRHRRGIARGPRRGAAGRPCRYEDGRGPSLAFGPEVFPALADLHGDKGVWRLLDQGADQVKEVPIAGPIPRDIDTPEDYRAILEQPAQT